MGKAPAFQFYPADWLRDPELLRCTKAAKGVWIDMLCLSFACDLPGTFSSKGAPWTVEEIALAIGGDLTENTRLIDELIAKGVASRDENGAIYSRRMRRDHELRLARAEAGSVGGKHRAANATKKGPSKAASKPQANAQAKQGSSSSSSSSTSVNPPQAPKGAVRVTAEQVEAIYAAYPRKVAKADALKAIAAALQIVPFEELLGAVTAYAESRLGPGKDPNRTPYPASWFRDHRWTDDRSNWALPDPGFVVAAAQKPAGQSEAAAEFEKVREIVRKFPPENPDALRAELEKLSPRTRAALKQIGGSSKVRGMTPETQGRVWGGFKAAFDSQPPPSRAGEAGGDAA